VIALAALSSAVEHIHNFSERKIDLELIGCHHDLRPRNILVSGTSFILADFGLSTFKPSSQRSETPFKHTNDDYLAPECEDWVEGFQAGTVHRASDIWSFGCIIAEVAVYMVLGCAGIKEFRQARQYTVRAFTFYQFHHGPKHPSDAVECWLSKLEKSLTRTPALLVRLVRQILSMDQSKRPTAKEITWRLCLVALYEVAATVDHLFHQFRKEDGSSLDMFLEHTRFNSWRHANGILNLEDEPNPQYKPSYNTMSQFGTILECLTRLRKDLKLRLSREGNAQYPDLSRLLKLNDELHFFLSREQKEISREYFNVTVMEEDGTLFDRLLNADTGAALNHEIRMRAKIKHINNLLARDSGSASRKMQVESNVVETRDPFGDHLLGWINNGQAPHPVLVEWRKYGKHGADEHTMEQIYGRTARIAELLSQEKPQAIRTLECSGFFHEPRRAAFGLIFEIPRLTVAGDSLQPTNLHQLIAKAVDDPSSRPDLDDRFKLASTLAISLLELHTVGWLHKSLMTSNVAFFPETGAQRQAIREPFFVGFNHSRPDEPMAFTSGIPNSSFYQHPTYLKDGCRYRPEFDYYGLGIILMEIGFWEPFSEITKAKRFTDTSYEDMRQKLLTHRVPRLRQHMGREYCEAVRCCIQGDFGESEFDNQKGMSSEALLLQFGERVVGRLNKYFI